MPRKLPWQNSSSSSTARPKRPATTPVPRRQKAQKPNSDNEVERSIHSFKRDVSRNQDIPASSSPPPDPPTESFMEEGKDSDDRYRMVEDEFLSIAQQFTVHLHAAEYKRQQKAVRSENAETINSISRPVTGKMPEQTKRKLEVAALAKRQRALIEGINGKKERRGNSDDSDIEELPYVGTTLHGLMDSPRKRAASLAKLGTIATTRAAAGYKKPAVQSKVNQHKSLIDSPEPKHSIRRTEIDLAMDSTEDDDDDLDAPILAPKLVAKDRKPVQPSNLHPMPPRPTAIEMEPLVSSSHLTSMQPFIKVEPPLEATSTGFTRTYDATDVAPKLSRLERIRLARAKKEKEQQIKKEEDYNTIPTI